MDSEWERLRLRLDYHKNSWGPQSNLATVEQQAWIKDKILDPTKEQIMKMLKVKRIPANEPLQLNST